MEERRQFSQAIRKVTHTVGVIAGGAGGGAVGSIVSQGVGVLVR